MRGISKTFPGVRALDNVSLTVYPGEVHSLMGENGAGKIHLDEGALRRLPGGSRRGNSSRWESGPASTARSQRKQSALP